VGVERFASGLNAHPHLPPKRGKEFDTPKDAVRGVPQEDAMPTNFAEEPQDMDT
jgi:hypothetical protein